VEFLGTPRLGRHQRVDGRVCSARCRRAHQRSVVRWHLPTVGHVFTSRSLWSCRDIRPQSRLRLVVAP
jgi:hypothetical protein